MNTRLHRFPWARFFRRRFPAHAEGWAYAQVVLVAALYRVVQRLRVIEAVRVAATTTMPSAVPAPEKSTAGNWLLPLVLGLWIGSTWGKDD